MITASVERRARELAESGLLPAYVYDLAALRTHLADVRAAVPTATAEVFYAAKANPDARVLAALFPYVDGVEVASGGELEHVRAALPRARIAFGGPGKTDAELALAVRHAERVHVESPWELTRLAAAAAVAGREVDVLLRVNLTVAPTGAALAMNGPFGMDPDLLAECPPILRRNPRLRLRGLHAHLASGLDAAAMAARAADVLAWALPWLDELGPGTGGAGREVNLGGGMAVDYGRPGARFDWPAYGARLAALGTPGLRLRIEPGRALTAYAGWYVTVVLDVKRAHGEWYAVLAGGTHHLRTPVTKGHDQPCTVLARPRGDGPSVRGEPVTLVGQLCTPKDVFARRVPTGRLAAGDVVAFALAGAYAWNISHHDFLMHPKPHFAYVDGPGASGGDAESAGRPMRRVVRPD